MLAISCGTSSFLTASVLTVCIPKTQRTHLGDIVRPSDYVPVTSTKRVDQTAGWSGGPLEILRGGGPLRVIKIKWGYNPCK